MYNNSNENNDVKSCLKSHFLREFNQQFSKINVPSRKSCAVYHHSDALDKFYALYLVLTKEIGQKGHLWPGATKVNLENLEPSCDWMI